ncbi:MAG: tRNA lysidine(34) synthetase TilS [Deltaproteobacteria bacterium]|nr:MAG: tRNA lysidine(34) synthetase TilS [Deltaproteobacteria bacterium]
MRSGSLLDQMEATIQRFGMFGKGARLIVAVSGGIDSVVCLDLLCRLRERFDLRLSVGHVNHGLRGEAAEGDAAFVQELAARHGLPFRCKRVDVAGYRASHRHVSPEEGARILRYRALEAWVAEAPGSRVVLAHHRDDQAETVLMSLLTGGGRLQGIPPCRGAFVRPLIEVPRERIERYAAERRLSYREDASNRSLHFLRNRIRHELLPMLEGAYNPQLRRHLARLGERRYLEKNHFRAMILSVWPQVVLRCDAMGAQLDVEAFRRLSGLLQEELLTEVLSRIGIRGVGDRHFGAIRRLASGRSPHRSLHLPGGGRIVRNYGRISVRRGAAPSSPPYHYELAMGVDLDIGETGLRIRADLAGRSSFPPTASIERFDLDEITLPLTVRNFRPGDRFQPLGMQGRQKLKDLFIDRKIPRDRRRKIPILLSGDRILWVVGIRRGEEAKLNAGTKRILEVACWPIPQREEGE